MASDPTTFYLAFSAVFGGIAVYLVVLDRHARALERRLAVLEQTEAANPKSPAASED